MHMVDSKYSLKLKNNHKPENKCIDAKKCQFLFVMQYWPMNCGTLGEFLHFKCFTLSCYCEYASISGTRSMVLCITDMTRDKKWLVMPWLACNIHTTSELRLSSPDRPPVHVFRSTRSHQSSGSGSTVG